MMKYYESNHVHDAGFLPVSSLLSSEARNSDLSGVAAALMQTRYLILKNR